MPIMKFKGVGNSVLAGLVGGTIALTGQSILEGAKNFYGSHSAPHMYSSSNISIIFKDNFAPAMKGYALRESVDEPINLNLYYNSPDTSHFEIPNKWRSEEKPFSFQVYAIDRDGNVSPEKTLYMVDGVVSKSVPKNILANL